jgi:hypothetical protein
MSPLTVLGLRERLTRNESILTCAVTKYYDTLACIYIDCVKELRNPGLQ